MENNHINNAITNIEKMIEEVSSQQSDRINSGLLGKLVTILNELKTNHSYDPLGYLRSELASHLVRTSFAKTQATEIQKQCGEDLSQTGLLIQILACLERIEKKLED